MSTSEIPGVAIRDLSRHPDERGYFLEVMKAEEGGSPFVQSNHSHSKKNVLRGLHYHRKQDDLWYFVSGEAQVVLVDLRTSGLISVKEIWVRDRQPVTIYIPRGVAHGFLAVSEVDLIYWVTREYDDTDEYGLAWNDPQLGVEWAIDQPLLSSRDAHNERLEWDLVQPFS